MIKIIFKDEVIRQFRVIHVSDEGIETEIDSAISVNVPAVGVGDLDVAIVEFVGVQIIQE